MFNYNNKNMKKRIEKTITTILIAVLSLSFSACSDTSGKKLDKNESTNLVEVIQVKEIQGNSEIPYSGTIEESESIPLSFSVVGSVAKVLVSEGDFVEKGQLLAVLNSETYKNAYEIALASQKQAEDAYKRLLPMYKNGNLPEIKFVKVQALLQQTQD